MGLHTVLYTAQRAANQFAMKGPEHVADVVIYYQIRNLIELGRFAIDDDECRAIAFGHERKTRRRPHHQRRADGEKQIALLGVIARLAASQQPASTARTTRWRF